MFCILVGILSSVPHAVITKAYAPILMSGTVFDAIAAWIVGPWAAPFHA